MFLAVMGQSGISLGAPDWSSLELPSVLCLVGCDYFPPPLLLALTLAPQHVYSSPLGKSANTEATYQLVLSVSAWSSHWPSLTVWTLNGSCGEHSFYLVPLWWSLGLVEIVQTFCQQPGALACVPSVSPACTIRACHTPGVWPCLHLYWGSHRTSLRELGVGVVGSCPSRHLSGSHISSEMWKKKKPHTPVHFIVLKYHVFVFIYIF